MTEGIKCIICGVTYMECPHGHEDIEKYAMGLAKKGVKLLKKLQKVTEQMEEYKRWEKAALKEGRQRKRELVSSMDELEDLIRHRNDE